MKPAAELTLKIRKLAIAILASSLVATGGACSLFGASEIPADVQGELDGLERAIALNPGDAGARRRLADLYYDYARDAEADRNYRILVERETLGSGALREIAERFKKMSEHYAWDIGRPAENVDPIKERSYGEYGRLLEGRAKFLDEGGGRAVSAWLQGEGGTAERLGRVMLACTNRQYESGLRGEGRLIWTYYGDRLPLVDAGRTARSDPSDYGLAELAELRVTPRAGAPAVVAVALRAGVARNGRCETCLPADECTFVGDRDGGGLRVVPLPSIGVARFEE